MNIVILLIAGLIVLYLEAIRPRIRKRPNVKPFFGWYYAHRGFHDNESQAPENSMAAFKKAIEKRYGMEMDVQLTKDGIPVVFHDETLSRACGVDGKVRDYTYEELQQFSLFKSTERIPEFKEFLNLVDGQVPLIIEIKIYENIQTVCSAVDEILCKYAGTYCIESFHPIAVKWYKEHRPEVVRGQLSSDFQKPDSKTPFAQKLVQYLITNFLCRPDFIAYNHRFKRNVSRQICKKLYQPLNVAWTVKSQEELDACRKDFDLFIFEGFTPES